MKPVVFDTQGILVTFGCLFIHLVKYEYNYYVHKTVQNSVKQSDNQTQSNNYVFFFYQIILDSICPTFLKIIKFTFSPGTGESINE